MPLQPTRIGNVSLEYTSADDVDFDNDYLGIGSAANSGRTVKVKAKWLRDAIDPPLVQYDYIANVGLTADQSDSLITNLGAVAAITLTLPPAVAGMEFAVMRIAPYSITVAASGTDTIRGGAAGGSYVINSRVVTVFGCLVDGTWEVFIGGDITGYYNVLDFGADPTGVADSAPAFQSAIDVGGNGATVFAPRGTYKVGSALTLKAGTRITGQGMQNSGTVIVPAGSVTNVFTLDPGTLGLYCEGNQLSNFRVRSAASATLANVFRVIPNDTYLATELLLENLLIDTTDTACSNSAILLENVIGGTLRNISFRGDCSDAHIELSSADATHSVGCNALRLEGVYSTSNTSTPYGIKSVGSASAKHQGIQITQPTLQNHTTAGIYLSLTNGITITAPYLEANARALIAGDVASTADVKALNIVGGYLFGAAGKKGFLLDFVEGCTLTNVDFNGLTETNWIELGRVGGVHITQHIRSDSSVTIHDRILRNANMDDACGVVISDGGRQDGYGKMAVAPSITLLDTTLGASSARRHWIMRVDGTGAWTATQWNPTSV